MANIAAPQIGEDQRDPNRLLAAPLIGEYSPPITYDEDGTGSAVFSGAAVVTYVDAVEYDEFGSGSAVFSGSATMTYSIPVTYNEFGSGSAVFSGAATVGFVDALEYTEAGSGSAVFGGACTEVFFPGQLGSGSAVFGGAASYAFIRAPYLTATLPVLSASLGPAGIGAFISATLTPMESESIGLVGQIGSISSTIPAASVSVAGGSFGLSARMQSFECSLQGKVGQLGTMDVQLSRLQAYSGGTAAIIAEAYVQLPTIRSSADGLVGRVARISTSLPLLREQLTGIVGSIGGISVQLKPIVSDLDGYSSVSGTVNVTFPALRAAIDASVIQEQIRTLVMNTVTTAVSEYENYPFNSFAEFNGLYLAAGPDGLFIIDSSDKDDTVEIKAGFVSGQNDFRHTEQKRISDFYIGLRADGDLTLTITTDEGDPVSYAIETFGVEQIHQRRVITAKGAKGKYWQFGVENSSGCDFEVDSMNFTIVPLSRRI